MDSRRREEDGGIDRVIGRVTDIIHDRSPHVANGSLCGHIGEHNVGRARYVFLDRVIIETASKSSSISRGITWIIRQIAHATYPSATCIQGNLSTHRASLIQSSASSQPLHASGEMTTGLGKPREGEYGKFATV